MTRYRITSRTCGGYPAHYWRFEGSNNGVDWTVVHNGNDITNSWRDYSFTSPGSFTQFRWFFPQSGYVEIYEVELYGCYENRLGLYPPGCL